MTMPHYNDVQDTPLTTDESLREHVQRLLQSAVRRQIWIMLLDGEARPLPLLMPSDVDAEPRAAEAEAFGEMLNCLSLDFDGATVVLAFERPGPAEIVDRDRRWLRSLRDACVASGVPFRGPFLLLGDRLHQLPPDDYVGIPLVYSDDDEYDY